MDVFLHLTDVQSPAHAGLAVLICVLGAGVAMRLYGQARKSAGRAQITWMLLAGVIAGSTIWSNQIMVMIGFRSDPFPGFAPVATLTSLAAVILVATLGIVAAAPVKSPWRIAMGGAIFGIAIPLCHVWSLSGPILQNLVTWDPAMATLALAAGTGLGILALHAGASVNAGFRRLDGFLAFVAAIATTNLFALFAIIPEPGGVTVFSFSDDVLTFIAMGLTIMVLGVGYASYFSETAHRLETDSHLKHVAMNDMLTGLPNRTGLAARLETAVPEAMDAGDRLVVLALDLDDFQQINAKYGSDAGDDTLKAIAARLHEALGETGFAARPGADEFVAVKICSDPSPDTVKAIASRLSEVVSRPLALENGTIEPRVRIGAAVMPDHSANIARVVSSASLALARSRSTPNGHVCIYDPAKDDQDKSQRVLAMDLGKAIANGEMKLHYQPQHRVQTGEIVGFEALLRWDHPILGAVPPSRFIPIAEETGSILEIGDWVLRTACHEAANWPVKLSIAVNIAGAQLLRPDFPDVVARALKTSGLEPDRLEIEITEAGLLQDEDAALASLEGVRALGVSVAMDDFGTGYSSLSTLQTFPLDKIKVDRSFITNAGSNAAAAAIVRATIVLSKGLGIPVLAEGVESAEDLAFLRETGCAEAQGFYFGRPQPEPKFPARPVTESHTEKSAGRFSPAAIQSGLGAV